MDSQRLKINEKLLITIEEASEYSHIGEDRLRDLIKRESPQFVLRVGTRTLIKRKMFEQYIELSDFV